jgi:hypothetical protein
MQQKRSSLTLILVAVLVLAGTALTWAGEEEKDTRPEGWTPEMGAEMEAWMKLAQPGEHHEHLDPYAGKWKAEITMWMAADAEPMKNAAESEAKWIMDGRYMEWTHTGDFEGTPFQGRAIEAYNNGEERYESIWIDNFGTLVLFYTGHCSDGGKTRVIETESR